MSTLNILAIESSTTVCGVSIFLGNKIKDTIEIDKPRIHVKKLPVFIDKILSKNKVSISDFDGIAIAFGPGSYTGLRVGMSLAKGLAFSHNIPLVPVSTLDELNAQISFLGEYWIAIHSHRNFVYCQKFNSGISISEPNCELIDNIEDATIFGVGLHSLSKNIEFTQIVPTSKVVGELAIQNFNNWKRDDLHQVISNYLSAFNLNQTKPAK